MPLRRSMGILLVLLSTNAPALADDASFLQWVETAIEASTVTSPATKGLNEEGERFWDPEGWLAYREAQITSGNPTAIVNNAMTVTGEVRDLKIADSTDASQDKRVVEGHLSLTYKSKENEFVTNLNLRVYAKGEDHEDFRLLSMQAY